jgi:AcrR family transcriptional regulator
VPKIVKHEARRTEVAQAAWRVIIRDGLENLRIRDITDELGLTTSVVTHYFRDKEELMMFVLTQVFDRFELRQSRKASKLSGTKRLEALLLSSIPLDEKGLVEWKIWTAAIGRTIGHEKLLEAHRKHTARMRAVTLEELERARAQGLISAKVNLKLEVPLIMAVIDGLGINMVLDPEVYATSGQINAVKRLIKDVVARLLETAS